MSGTLPGPDGRERCRWCAAAPEFLDYHDKEWGQPVADDRRLFEKLCLEGFQSGLSWRTILAKRENFRAAFHDFDFARIARYTDKETSPAYSPTPASCATAARSKRSSATLHGHWRWWHAKAPSRPSSGATNP